MRQAAPAVQWPPPYVLLACWLVLHTTGAMLCGFILVVLPLLQFLCGSASELTNSAADCVLRHTHTKGQHEIVGLTGN